MTRVQEILQAVDHLIRVHDEWEADNGAPDVPTAAFEAAVKGAVEVVNVGDTPGQCRSLVDAVCRLGVEWEKYEGGMMRPDHRPVSRFWGAYRAVLDARKIATPFVPHRPEPVKLLLDQGVSYRQIALHIYGDGESGPLADDNGQPDMTKIMAEAAHPGSVVPADWMHPDEARRMKKYEEETARRLTAVDRLEHEEAKIDPASIEQLLREGQYPDVVAKVKAVTLEEVTEIADKLRMKGVQISERPNLGALRAPQEPAILPEADRALQPQAAEPEATTGEVSGEASAADVEALIALVHEANRDMGAGELVALLKSEHGTTVTVQKVAKVLSKQRQSGQDAA